MLARMKKVVLLHRQTTSGNSSVGRARPCQGRGREFESRFPLFEIPIKFGIFRIGTKVPKQDA